MYPIMSTSHAIQKKNYACPSVVMETGSEEDAQSGIFNCRTLDDCVNVIEIQLSENIEQAADILPQNEHFLKYFIFFRVMFTS